MRTATRRLAGAIAVALVGAASLVAFDGSMSGAAAQPCGYPPFPPCRPLYVPPPPPPVQYYQPRQVVIGYTCKVPGPNCELYNGRPVGSTCWCRGRKGYVDY